MRTYLFMLVLLCVAFTSCAKKLRPDPFLAATTANRAKVEMITRDLMYMGLATCGVEQGKPYDDCGLEVFGYGQGTVYAISEACDLFYPIRYTQSGYVKIPIPGTAGSSCLIDLVVLPEFPNEKNSGVVIHPLVGQLFIRALSHKQNWTGIRTQIPVDGRAQLPLGPAGKGSIIINGCGTSLELPFDGAPSLDSSVFRSKGLSRCVYDIVVITADAEHSYSWVVWHFDPKYVDMAIPQVELSGDTLRVNAEESVAVLALDAEWTLDSPAKFDIDPNQKHYLRVLSTAGRNIIGYYTVEKGWQWIR